MCCCATRSAGRRREASDSSASAKWETGSLKNYCCFSSNCGGTELSLFFTALKPNWLKNTCRLTLLCLRPGTFRSPIICCVLPRCNSALFSCSFSSAFSLVTSYASHHKIAVFGNQTQSYSRLSTGCMSCWNAFMFLLYEPEWGVQLLESWVNRLFCS